MVSSSASDTATKAAYYGRDATGAIQTQTLTLNGQSWVTGSQPLERLLYAALSGASANGPVANPGGTAAVGDVALAAHSCVLPVASVTNDATVRTAQPGSANSSGTTPALFKLQSGDGASVSAGQIIWTKGGTGPNQLAQIIATTGYGTDVVAVSKNWGAVPDATTTYKILQGMSVRDRAQQSDLNHQGISTSSADIPGGSRSNVLREGFLVNNNIATSLTGAQIEIASETPTLPVWCAPRYRALHSLERRRTHRPIDRRRQCPGPDLRDPTSLCQRRLGPEIYHLGRHPTPPAHRACGCASPCRPARRRTRARQICGRRAPRPDVSAARPYSNDWRRRPAAFGF